MVVLSDKSSLARMVTKLDNAALVIIQDRVLEPWLELKTMLIRKVLQVPVLVMETAPVASFERLNLSRFLRLAPFVCLHPQCKMLNGVLSLGECVYSRLRGALQFIL